MARGRKPKRKIEVDIDGDGKPDIDISLHEIQGIEPEKEKPDKPKPPAKTLDELIDSLYKKPEKHRFIAPRLTGYKLAVGTRTIAFKKSPTTKVGELITDDPWVIEQLLRNRHCNLHYYPESAKLRNYQR
jgi:hypothetical protein